MAKIGIADTTFARYDMAVGIAPDERGAYFRYAPIYHCYLQLWVSKNILQKRWFK